MLPSYASDRPTRAAYSSICPNAQVIKTVQKLKKEKEGGETGRKKERSREEEAA